MRPKQVRMRCGSGCGTGSKMIALGYGNSLVPQARQYDEENSSASSGSTRCLHENNVCGFSAGCADFRAAVRITRGLEPSENGLLGLKTADFKPIRRKIPMMNPHKSSKIRTASPESAQPAENPHTLFRIRTTCRKSAQSAGIGMVRFPMPRIADDLFAHHAKDPERDGLPLPRPRETGISPSWGRNAHRSSQHVNPKSLEFRHFQTSQ